ncbi:MULTISPECIES: type VI secretion system-associated FHA domain protein TagH [Burkholderia]|uniref:type VI secretion system-associated FHA domain protein TagH n=1 Tax=Burkholderia TaxID=32008 RepID=UPI00119A8085|nr:MULTISPECIES: type VI secretion system-associated FHA domain protein TagH [Burkholderia]MDN7736590.1 type VI secretion system-associated FHA domain protein TagH [Burkholderia gladioli]TWC76167.1 FHA domain protein [Burkholderia sp. SJZ089]TWD06486.1 FHA domain protein [Burkholderia sp. SJZ115]TWD10368.1 FHA domain protein [Burkholderia sp. SJZ091]
MSTEPSLTLAVQGERAERLAQREQRFDRRDGSIGRADDCDWVLGAEGVSRLHALIRYLNGLYFVEDRSTNGMLLNGAPLRKGDPAALRDGDRLQIDTFEIAVRLGGETGGNWQARTDRAPTAPVSTSTPRVPPVPAVPAAGAAALSSSSSSSSAENREPLDLGALLSPRPLDAQGDAGRPDGLIPGARDAAVPGSSLDPLALFDAPSSYYDEAPGAVPADQGWNHTPSPSDRFRPPRVAGARPAGALLPDDWDATGSRFTPPAAPSARQWDDSLLAPASNAAPAIPPAASGEDDSLLAPAPLRAAESAPAMQSSASHQDDARPGSSPARAAGAAPVIPPSASREDDSLLGSVPARAAGAAPVPPSSARYQNDSSSDAIPVRAAEPSPSRPDDSLPRPATVAPAAPQHDDALPDLIPARAADAAPVLRSSALQHDDSLLAPIPAHAAEVPPLAPANPAARDQAAPSAARASAADAAPSTRSPATAAESAAPVARPVAFGAAEASPRSQAASPAEPAGADLTAMFEIAVDAMMDVLRARAELKNSFRLPATLIQRSENNPLKFAPTAREAVRRLLAPPDSGFLAGSAALADAADDIRNHQMAMLAGVRSAFESLLAQFDPARIEQESEGGGRRLSLGGNRPRHWERYKEQFEALTRNPDECFRRLFGDEFARAYEEQLARLKQRRP